MRQAKNIRKTHTHNNHGHKANANLTTRQEREALTRREFFFVFIEMKNEMKKRNEKKINNRKMVWKRNR